MHVRVRRGGAVRRRCGLGQDFSELWGGVSTGARVVRGGTCLGFALGGVLCVHGGVEGYAVEAGCLWQRGERARETRECDELVVTDGGHCSSSSSSDLG